MGGVLKKLSLIVIASFFCALCLPLATYALSDAQIAFHSSGQSSNVISNEYFLDKDSMTVQQIQSFLDANSSYLKDYSDGGRSAAQIIWDAAHGKYEASGSLNGITISEATGTVSPKVILVYLQKEQSLISRTTYQAWAMTASMGYYCYAGVTGDNNGNNCKDIYEGFTKQVENGAWQLRYNYERSSGTGFSDYQVGQAFHTSDGYDITLTTRATSAVYRYTPYIYYSAYNVWNLFYNVYDFDQGGGIANPDNPPTENDTAAVSARTSRDTISYSGLKIPNCRVYLGDQIIADLSSSGWSISFTPAIGANTYTLVYKDPDGVTLNSKTFTITKNKRADSNGDDLVDSTELSILADAWGKTVEAYTAGDYNGDGSVDSTDLSILADAWGK